MNAQKSYASYQIGTFFGKIKLFFYNLFSNISSSLSSLSKREKALLISAISLILLLILVPVLTLYVFIPLFSSLFIIHPKLGEYVGEAGGYCVSLKVEQIASEEDVLEESCYYFVNGEEVSIQKTLSRNNLVHYNGSLYLIDITLTNEEDKIYSPDFLESTAYRNEAILYYAFQEDEYEEEFLAKVPSHENYLTFVDEDTFAFSFLDLFSYEESGDFPPLKCYLEAK